MPPSKQRSRERHGSKGRSQIGPRPSAEALRDLGAREVGLRAAAAEHGALALAAERRANGRTSVQADGDPDAIPRRQMGSQSGLQRRPS